MCGVPRGTARISWQGAKHGGRWHFPGSTRGPVRGLRQGGDMVRSLAAGDQGGGWCYSPDEWGWGLRKMWHRELAGCGRWTQENVRKQNVNRSQNSSHLLLTGLGHKGTFWVLRNVCVSISGRYRDVSVGKKTRGAVHLRFVYFI